MMDLETMYRRSVDGWTERVAEVGHDQWGAVTPCDDWDVLTLVNHVVGEDLWTEPLVRGATIEEVGNRFEGDLLGDDPVGAATTAATQATEAVAERLPGLPKVHLSYGDEDIEEYVAQLTADHLIHGWDLAAAIGGDTRLDEDLMAAVAEWYAEREEIYRSAGMVAERVPGQGDPQSELLGRFGRDARWSPPG
jgi:uncharacterized protein (TIGR03086 family)